MARPGKTVGPFGVELRVVQRRGVERWETGRWGVLLRIGVPLCLEGLVLFGGVFVHFLLVHLVTKGLVHKRVLGTPPSSLMNARQFPGIVLLHNLVGGGRVRVHPSRFLFLMGRGGPSHPFAVFGSKGGGCPGAGGDGFGEPFGVFEALFALFFVGGPCTTIGRES